MTYDCSLVEVFSGTLIEVLEGENRTQRVILRSSGLERELYRGSDGHAYVAGLARAWRASTAEGLITYGRGWKTT